MFKNLSQSFLLCIGRKFHFSNSCELWTIRKMNRHPVGMGFSVSFPDYMKRFADPADFRRMAGAQQWMTVSFLIHLFRKDSPVLSVCTVLHSICYKVIKTTKNKNISVIHILHMYWVQNIIGNFKCTITKNKIEY